MTIWYVEKFLHMADFSPQALPVVPVTNIRYGWMLGGWGVDVRWMGTRRVVTSGESHLTNVPITGSSVKKAREYLERKVLKRSFEQDRIGENGERFQFVSVFLLLS